MQNNNGDVTIKISKKTTKIFLSILAGVIALCFIPIQKEISLPEHETSTSYRNATSSKYKAYRTNTACLYEYNSKYEYEKSGKSCQPLATNVVAEIIRLSNGACNFRVENSVIATIVSDCKDFYIKGGKLYERATFVNKDQVDYQWPVDVRIVSGSSISVENYYTVECRAFGLFCSSGKWLEDGTTVHSRLVIGRNAKIRKYKTTCDGQSNRAKIDKENCIYADDTYIDLTIAELLKS